MSVDPNEAPAGYVAIPLATGDGVACRGCSFYVNDGCSNFDAVCVPRHRNDGQHVIFVRQTITSPGVTVRDPPDFRPVVGDTPQTHYVLDPDNSAPMRLVNKAMIAMLNAVFADRLRTMDQIPEELRPLFKEVKP